MSAESYKVTFGRCYFGGDPASVAETGKGRGKSGCNVDHGSDLGGQESY